LRDVGAEHRSILEAALARDARKARELLAAHYENTSTFVRAYMQSKDKAKAASVFGDSTDA
jgi:DNA-binding GntR family transcriptional regulator